MTTIITADSLPTHKRLITMETIMCLPHDDHVSARDVYVIYHDDHVISHDYETYSGRGCLN